MARIRAWSTSRPAASDLACVSAPEVSRNESGRAIHSICQEPVARRLESFADFGLHHQLDVGRKLCQRSHHQAEKAADLGDAIAMAVPCDIGLAQPKRVHQCLLGVEAAGRQRRERSDRAGKLADQNARRELGLPLPVPLDGRQQRGDFEAERDRHRVLQIAAPDHGGVAMAARQVGERT